MAKRIVIGSGKGGVGKTTVTVGVGKALNQLGYQVLLVDFDNLRSIDLLLGTTEKAVFDWGDVILKRCEPKEAVCENHGISALTCPASYSGFDEKGVRQLIRIYDRLFDFILIDAPAGIGTGFALACCGAEKGIVVATPDLVCVRSACRAGDEMKKYGVNESRLVINRAVKSDIKKKKLLNIDDMIDMSEVQLVGIVPEDKKIRFGSMGLSIFEKNQISRRAFLNIAKRLIGLNVPLDFD